MGYARSRPPLPAGARPAILTPTKWLAKFVSRCRSCHQPIKIDEMIAGVRPEGGRWAVWHDQPSCHVIAEDRHFFLPLGMEPEIAATRKQRRAMQATAEEEWLKEYDA